MQVIQAKNNHAIIDLTSLYEIQNDNCATYYLPRIILHVAQKKVLWIKNKER